MKYTVLYFVIVATTGGFITMGAHRATDSLWSLAFSIPLTLIFGFCASLAFHAAKDR